MPFFPNVSRTRGTTPDGMSGVTPNPATFEHEHKAPVLPL